MSKRNDSKRTTQAISDAVQPAIRRRRRITRYVAFHPDRPGFLIPDDILRNIMAAAERGLMTDAGRKLILVLDTRHGRTDESAGMRTMKSLEKGDCVTLAELYRG